MSPYWEKAFRSLGRVREEPPTCGCLMVLERNTCNACSIHCPIQPFPELATMIAWNLDAGIKAELKNDSKLMCQAGWGQAKGRLRL